MSESKTLISHIVAASSNRVIGREGGLPWHLSEDLKFFKQKTLHHALIMGRKTFESIGRALPQRLNVIVTRQTDFHPPGTFAFPTLGKALEFCRSQSNQWGQEIFIAGGGEIFTQSMSLVQRIYLTEIHQEISGDTYYPPIDKTQFKEVSRLDHSSPISFSFVTLERIHSPVT